MSAIMPTPSSANSPIAATTAPVTDQVVIADLAECLVERLASGGRPGVQKRTRAAEMACSTTRHNSGPHSRHSSS